MKEAAAPLIALVDDEEHLRTTVAKALRRDGYRVRGFADGAEAWREFEKSLPDLVILDIIMPRMDGLELCRRLRSISEAVPVMFLTSRDDEFDRVLGLELGADDYLCKPFSLRELVARVKVLFRRAGIRVEERAAEPQVAAGEPAVAAGAPGAAAGAESDRQIVAGPLSLDTRRFTASWRGTPFRLTVTEFRILRALAGQQGFVKTREQLLAEAFPQDSYMSDRTIDCHIRRIRAKLELIDETFDGIETLYGLGYRWKER